MRILVLLLSISYIESVYNAVASNDIVYAVRAVPVTTSIKAAIKARDDTMYQHMRSLRAFLQSSQPSRAKAKFPELARAFSASNGYDDANLSKLSKMLEKFLSTKTITAIIERVADVRKNAPVLFSNLLKKYFAHAEFHYHYDRIRVFSSTDFIAEQKDLFRQLLLQFREMRCYKYRSLRTLLALLKKFMITDTPSLEEYLDPLVQTFGDHALLYYGIHHNYNPRAISYMLEHSVSPMVPGTRYQDGLDSGREFPLALAFRMIHPMNQELQEPKIYQNAWTNALLVAKQTYLNQTYPSLDGDTFLLHAIRSKNYAALEVLIQCSNIDVNTLNFGEIPLNVAVERNDYKAVEILLKRQDIRINVITGVYPDWKTPYERAKENDFDEIKSLLKAKGAETITPRRAHYHNNPRMAEKQIKLILEREDKDVKNAKEKKMMDHEREKAIPLGKTSRKSNSFRASSSSTSSAQKNGNLSRFANAAPQKKKQKPKNKRKSLQVDSSNLVRTTPKNPKNDFVSPTSVMAVTAMRGFSSSKRRKKNARGGKQRQKPSFVQQQINAQQQRRNVQQKIKAIKDKRNADAIKRAAAILQAKRLKNG